MSAALAIAMITRFNIMFHHQQARLVRTICRINAHMRKHGRWDRFQQLANIVYANDPERRGATRVHGRPTP